MRRGRFRIWFVGLLALPALVGCLHNSARPYPADPLLLSKRPVASRPESAQPVVVAFQEPRPPTLSEVLVAEAERRNGPVRQFEAMPASRRKDNTP